jgi:Zn-dependent M16 (insulinase) family peptidase
MNIVKKIEQYDQKCVFFCEPIKNNVMNEGNFIRILYSNFNLTLNGIYLLITLNDITCEKYYSKYKCSFNPANHKELISKLKIIEEEIIEKYNFADKIPQYKIYDQLINGNIKISNDIGSKTQCNLILKISGIWETQDKYGLTFKFIKIN